VLYHYFSAGVVLTGASTSEKKLMQTAYVYADSSMYAHRQQLISGHGSQRRLVAAEIG